MIPQTACEALCHLFETAKQKTRGKKMRKFDPGYEMICEAGETNGKSMHHTSHKKNSGNGNDKLNKKSTHEFSNLRLRVRWKYVNTKLKCRAKGLK